MAASTAPAVKAQLLTLLQADAALDGVGITYSDPAGEITQEALFFGRTLTGEKPDAMGQRRQREEYDVEVYIYTAQDGNDPQACEERAWALVAELENVVRAANGPQGALTQQLTGGGYAYYNGTEMTPFIAGGQRVCEALCKVHVCALK